MPPIIPKIIASHLVVCQGADFDNKPIFFKEERPQVIINVLEEGVSMPLCRHYYEGRCNHDLKLNPLRNLDKYSLCFYALPPRS